MANSPKSRGSSSGFSGQEQKSRDMSSYTAACCELVVDFLGVRSEEINCASATVRIAQRWGEESNPEAEFSGQALSTRRQAVGVTRTPPGRSRPSQRGRSEGVVCSTSRSPYILSVHGLIQASDPIRRTAPIAFMLTQEHFEEASPTRLHGSSHHITIHRSPSEALPHLRIDL